MVRNWKLESWPSGRTDWEGRHVLLHERCLRDVHDSEFQVRLEDTWFSLHNVKIIPEWRTAIHKTVRNETGWLQVESFIVFMPIFRLRIWKKLRENKTKDKNSEEHSYCHRIWELGIRAQVNELRSKCRGRIWLVNSLEPYPKHEAKRFFSIKDINKITCNWCMCYASSASGTEFRDANNSDISSTNCFRVV